MKVHADRDACISAGNCVMTAGEVFDQDDDGIVVVLTPVVPTDAEDDARQAITLCPASALRLAD